MPQLFSPHADAIARPDPVTFVGVSFLMSASTVGFWLQDSYGT
jgi:hypothetical protein